MISAWTKGIATIKNADSLEGLIEHESVVSNDAERDLPDQQDTDFAEQPTGSDQAENEEENNVDIFLEEILLAQEADERDDEDNVFENGMFSSLFEESV